MWSKLKHSAAFWFGLTFVLAAAVLLASTVVEIQTHKRLLGQGEVTEAAVIDQGQSKDDDGVRSHWIKIQYYDLTRREFTHQHAVPQSLWEKHPVGSNIRVRYLRDDPEKVTPEAMLDEPEWKTLLALGLTFGAIGVAIVSLAMVKAGRLVTRK